MSPLTLRTHSRADECRDLLHVFDEASTSLNVRVALEANMGKMLEVANERINLVDNSDKAKPRPAVFFPSALPAAISNFLPSAISALLFLGE